MTKDEIIEYFTKKGEYNIVFKLKGLESWQIVNPDFIYALPLNSIKSLCEAVMKNFVNGTDNTFEILYSAELNPCPFINVKK